MPYEGRVTMAVKVHPHARERMQERGASENEVTKTVETGERFPAKFGRSGFRRNFVFDGVWRGKKYKTKQIEVYGVEQATDFIVITVVVKYF